MRLYRYPHLAAVFGADAAEAEAAIATDLERRTDRQRELAAAYTQALVRHAAAQLRSPDARPRPKTDWVRQ